MDTAKPLSLKSRALDYLLVDDDRTHWRLVQVLLKEMGLLHRCHYVPSGSEALDFLHGRLPYVGAPRPNLILLDLNLPGMSGCELLSFLKGDPITLSIPVIILSSSRADADVNACYGNHANAYIQKPVDLDGNRRLLEQIDQFWSYAVLPTT